MQKTSRYIVSVQGDDESPWIWMIFVGFSLIEQSKETYPTAYAAMDAGKRRKAELEAEDEGAGDR